MDVSFFDTMVGTMVLVGGHIYRTEEGGASWTEEVNEAESTMLNAVVTIDANTGVAAGDYWFGSQAAVIIRRR